MEQTLERFFHLRERGSTVATEFRGAVATFLTMAYILFVNPSILSAAGVPFNGAVAATALAASICCILMGVVANFPLALASGMGLNAVVAFQIAKAAGSWQAAMGVIVLDGVVTTLLVVCGLREAIMHAIPRDLRLAIGAGIGLFIAFIGLVNAKVVVPGVAGGPPVWPGNLRDPATTTALIGLLLTAVLIAHRIKGALVIGILSTTVIALALKVAKLPESFVKPELMTVAFQADIRGAMRWELVPLLFAVVMVDFFDTLGTASAVADEAGLMDDRGRIPGIRRILLIDSISAGIGGLMGASSVTSYVESAAGVAEGARTGLHTVFVGLFFLAAVVAAPVAGIVPPAATAPALVLVGFLMISQVARIDFENLSSSIPAFVILLTIPLTYSIAHGIGYGFLTFIGIKTLSGRPGDAHPLMYAASAAFLAYFLWGHG